MYIVLFLILSVLVYSFIIILKDDKIAIIEGKNIKLVSDISGCLEELKKRQIFLRTTKLLTPINVIITSILLFVISTILLNLVIGVLSTSIIVSVPILISPIIISQILIKKNKQKILSNLPMYAVNLKNYITEENNIISAITRSNTEYPLKIFTDKFKNNVLSGMNVIEALDRLNKDVQVKEFSDLIEGIKLCYINGGNFISVLEKYIAIITKEQIYKEEAEEKAYSSMLTLIIMLFLNIAVVLFMLNNNEYSSIIRTTFTGKLILNFNAISYMGIAALIGKIYKEE